MNNFYLISILIKKIKHFYFIFIHRFLQDLRQTQNVGTAQLKGKWKKMFYSKIILPFLFRYYHTLKYAIISKHAQKNGDNLKQKMLDNLIKLNVLQIILHTL